MIGISVSLMQFLIRACSKKPHLLNCICLSQNTADPADPGRRVPDFDTAWIKGVRCRANCEQLPSSESVKWWTIQKHATCQRILSLTPWESGSGSAWNFYLSLFIPCHVFCEIFYRPESVWYESFLVLSELLSSVYDQTVHSEAVEINIRWWVDIHNALPVVMTSVPLFFFF